MQIPVLKPTMRRRYMHSVLTQLVDEDIGPGKTTRELVSALSAYVGGVGGIALSSMYTALAIAAEAIGLRTGDRVVVPALAPSVYLDVLRSRGLDPVLADCDPASGAVSGETLRVLLSEGAKAVFACHALGLPMQYDAATEAGVPVIEDVTYSLAPAPAAEDGLERAQADLVLVALSPEGAITAGGGAVLLARKRPLLAGLKSVGGNAAQHGQLPNMCAALALAQLGDLDADRARRLEIAGTYRAALKKSRHEALVAHGEDGIPSHSLVVRLRDGLAEVRQYARKHGVETRPAFEGTCITASDLPSDSCPNARKLELCCLLFPLYPMLSKRSIESVSRVLATLP